MSNLYNVTTEHTAGEGRSHDCSDGYYIDPADAITGEAFEGETAHDAETAARAELVAIVNRDSGCACHRCGMVGSESWWSDVSITAADANP